MQRPMRDILVGFTVIIGLAGVAVLLMLFGELKLGEPRTYPITLQLDQVSGISSSSRVTLNGVLIGSVETITVSPDPRDGAVVTIRVRDAVRIPRDSVIVLERGLVGEATLLFRTNPGPPDVEPDYIRPDEIVRARALSVVEDLANALESRLGGLRDFAESFTKLADTYVEVGQRANELLSPRSTTEVDAGAPATIPSTLARLDSAVADARLWLGDESLRLDARAIAAQMRGLMDTSAAAVEEWTKAAQALTSHTNDIGTTAAEALREFAASTRALQETLTQAQQIAAKVNAGEGTVGLLVNNPDLYRSLNDAAQRLEKALIEAQLLVEKYRKEGVPIQF